MCHCQVKIVHRAIIFNMIDIKDIQARLREEIKGSSLSQKEIAEEFSISVNTVKKHINNANHYMKKRLKNFWNFIVMLQAHP